LVTIGSTGNGMTQESHFSLTYTQLATSLVENLRVQSHMTAGRRGCRAVGC
jgi:hypothetical protein